MVMVVTTAGTRNCALTVTGLIQRISHAWLLYSSLVRRVLLPPSYECGNRGSERLSDFPEVCCCWSCCLIAQPCPSLCDPIDCGPPGSSVHRVTLQEYWSELLFPSPGALPNPGIRPVSPAPAGGFFTTEPPGKPAQLHSKTGRLWSTSSQSLYLIWEGKPGWEADAGPRLAGNPLLDSFPASVTFQPRRHKTVHPRPC